MEPAKIDWDRVVSTFVEDIMYENINAPQWVNLLDPDDGVVDDDSWFCRADCNHPKTAEDFLRAASLHKLPISADRSETLVGSCLQRTPKLKRRGQNQSSCEDDCENQNPNVETPPLRHTQSLKEAIKSSGDRKKAADDGMQRKQSPRLKSTMSASNLFSGKNIFSHITELYNDLKKMTVRAKEKEDTRKAEVKEKTPFLKTAAGKSEQQDEGIFFKDKSSKLRHGSDDTENVPLTMNVDKGKTKQNSMISSPKIRTNPPLPQRFTSTLTPLKGSKSKHMERGILHELRQKNGILDDDKEGNCQYAPAVEREARAQDILWIFKPCTLPR